MWTNTFMILVC